MASTLTETVAEPPITVLIPKRKRKFVEETHVVDGNKPLVVDGETVPLTNGKTKHKLANGTTVTIIGTTTAPPTETSAATVEKGKQKGKTRARKEDGSDTVILPQTNTEAVFRACLIAEGGNKKLSADAARLITQLVDDYAANLLQKSIFARNLTGLASVNPSHIRAVRCIQDEDDIEPFDDPMNDISVHAQSYRAFMRVQSGNEPLVTLAAAPVSQ